MQKPQQAIIFLDIFRRATRFLPFQSILRRTACRILNAVDD
jgi:hypothetical protein